MTKEELMEKMDKECPDSEISYDHPAPLLYRIYRMYKEMQEYSCGVICVFDYENEPSNVAVTMRFASEDEDGCTWAFITVYKDGTWDTDGHFVDLPLVMGAEINEGPEDEAMGIFVLDLPPFM